MRDFAYFSSVLQKLVAMPFQHVLKRIHVACVQVVLPLSGNDQPEKASGLPEQTERSLLDVAR